MQKFISAELLHTTATHYIVELLIETKKPFRKPVQSKVKVFREKHHSVWHGLKDGRWIDYSPIGDSLTAFISTAEKSITF